MDMRIAVLGATGVYGRHLVPPTDRCRLSRPCASAEVLRQP